ncbi:hypothetical protein BCY91_08860 [Pelobium manganitolerans]|uniref:DUF3817 domain-containing protein n=1 Tax=Pelobium manganitolerans TaxID=1842495 RepID=A0A419S310_9SPHI|nr:DUF3817 domain-containing protein [Pelobium manganitolerans]RKD13675.1 hypothetical protein BCY91_08860 [Pelobium manganitolerans]
MKNLSSQIAQFRLICFLEGVTLLVLVFIAVPMKYVFHNPIVSEIFGPIHGALFIAYVGYTVLFAAKYKWSFKKIFWVSIASFFPFATFYVEKRVLSKIPA